MYYFKLAGEYNHITKALEYIGVKENEFCLLQFDDERLSSLSYLSISEQVPKLF